MADTPAPAPLDAAATLAAATPSGGTAYLAEADRLTAAGVALPFAERATVAAMRASRDRIRGTPQGAIAAKPSAIMDRLDGMVASGQATPAQAADLAAIEGLTNYKPDDRTPAQKAHDKTHGADATVNPGDYWLPLPEGESIDSFAQLGSDARDLAASLALDANAGSKLIGDLLSVGSELASLDPAGRAATQERWLAQLQAVFPGDRLKAACEAVDELLEAAGDNLLVKRAAERGVFRNPTLFVRLANRAVALRQWHAGRPS
jgi:hypothetical protein